MVKGSRYKDLSGKKFGRLTVIRDVGRLRGNVLWECQCDCGNIVSIISAELLREKRGAVSCGCLRRENAIELKSVDLIGRRFNRLVVIKKVGISKDGAVLWKCVCDCKEEAIVASRDLLSGHTKSCGCLQKEKASKRMKERNKIYKGDKHPCWKGGIDRPYPENIWTPNFRTKIRKRDNYTCQICGKKQRGLDVHHIDENKFNCKPDNLITLCRKCHRNIHCGNIELLKRKIAA